ncbi:MAG: hypothetical protein [Olavius algarvensis Delta 4 endosymbiont]|nr:MAG: hypothetical protein [Olavius algarvensis Delta 4 endosymbiont]
MVYTAKPDPFVVYSAPLRENTAFTAQPNTSDLALNTKAFQEKNKRRIPLGF